MLNIFKIHKLNSNSKQVSIVKIVDVSTKKKLHLNYVKILVTEYYILMQNPKLSDLF